jgi:hypothetical protein
MATNSKFLQINPQILVEYIYDDPVSPEVLESDEYKIEILNNAYNSKNYLFNTDDSGLRNLRDTSAVPINNLESRYVILNKDIPISYNDFDSNLTNTVNLLPSFVPELEVQYDTIKIHFVSGFTFGDYDGYIFEINLLQLDDKYSNILSQKYLKTDFPLLNPNPLLVGDKLYSTYLEYKIPSFEYVYNSWASDKNNDNTLGYKLSNGKGYYDTSKIELSLKGIFESYDDNSFNFLKVRELNKVYLNKKDDFENLSAFIQESTAGDFYELYGKYNGDIFADFMAALNQRTDADHVVFHEIVVKEQIGETFVETSRQNFVQSDSFETPMYFRPIILNSNIAVSYSIDYQLRIFNKTDNSQIIKRAQLISTDVRKYGRNFTKLNLGTVPTIAKVYNKIENDNAANVTYSDVLNVNNTISETIIKKEFVKLFQDKINITVSINPISVQNTQ